MESIDITREFGIDIFRTQINSDRILVTCENKSEMFDILLKKMNVTQLKSNFDTAPIISEKLFMTKLISWLKQCGIDSIHFTYDFAISSQENIIIKTYFGAPTIDKSYVLCITMNLKNTLTNTIDKYYILCQNLIINDKLQQQYPSSSEY